MADDALLELMAAHMRMPFPRGCRGRDIDGLSGPTNKEAGRRFTLRSIYYIKVPAYYLFITHR